MPYIIVFLLVALVVVVIDRHLTLSGVEQDLGSYLVKVRRAAELVDDPSLKVHYGAVEATLSLIYNTYFTKELHG